MAKVKKLDNKEIKAITKIGEQPRYKAIQQYERQFKTNYGRSLGAALELMMKKMKQFEKVKKIEK